MKVEHSVDTEIGPGSILERELTEKIAEDQHKLGVSIKKDPSSMLDLLKFDIFNTAEHLLILTDMSI